MRTNESPAAAVPAAGGPDIEDRETSSGSPWARLLLAGVLLVILILLLTVRSCTYVNLATFVPPAEGGEASIEGCLECHPDKVYEGVGASHGPEKVPCLRCHRQHELPGPGGDREDWGAFLISSQKELCVICHQSIGRRYNDSNQHPSFELGECTACHDPHGTDNHAMLFTSPEELCKTCHFLLDSMSRPVRHDPFMTGDCLGCHDPHASDYTGMTHSPQPVLCTSCHQDLGSQMEVQSTHAPVGQECTLCHEPHSAGVGRLLLEEPPDLCYRCHQSVGAEFRLSSKHPVPGRMNCTSCHFPHTSAFSSLLHAGGNGVCRECHAQKVTSTAATAHAKVSRGGRPTGSCRNCHLWHGSDYEPLLPKREVPLCGECHERKTHPRTNHPHDAPYWDGWHNQTMRCSSCHNPHGSGISAMTHKAKDGLCLTCHPRVGVDF